MNLSKQSKFLLLMGLIIVGLRGGIVLSQEAEEDPRQLFNYDSHGKRDPLWELVNSAGKVVSYDTDFILTDLNLEGIVSGNNGENLAIINGKVVKPKDPIGQFIVKEIKEDAVILMKNQETFELRLKKEE